MGAHRRLIFPLQLWLRCSGCCRFAAASAAARWLGQPLQARRPQRGALVVTLHQLRHRGLIRADRLVLGGRLRLLSAESGAAFARFAAERSVFRLHIHLSGEEQVGLRGGDHPVQGDVFLPLHLLEHPHAPLLLVLGLSGAQLGAEQRLGFGLKLFPHRVLLGRAALLLVRLAALHPRLASTRTDRLLVSR